MKAVLTIITMAMFTVALGSAYANEVPSIDSKREIGYVIREFAPMHDPTLAGSPEVTAPVDFGEVDLGTALYHDAFMTREAVPAGYGFKGSAAGGMTSEDESTRIWDKLLAPSGSDWP
jgi:hypothetical protein